MKPQTLTPERFFQLSPAQVSLNFSPARGIERNVQTSLPVCMSQARTSPAGPWGGFSCVRPPVMMRFLIHGRRRAQAVAAGQALQDLGRVQVDAALVAERVVGLAGLRVEREEPAVARAEDDLRRRLRVAGPVLDAARRGVARRELEHPHLLARRRVERDDAAVRRGDVHHAVDDERRGLAGREARAAASASASRSRAARGRAAAAASPAAGAAGRM